MTNKSLWIIGSVVFLSLFAIQYGSTHIDRIVSAQADYYYAKKDFSKAEKLYQTAFELGVNDSIKRENYVNILINLPPTIENQEKLVNFTKYPEDDTARLEAERFLYELRRKIANDYPENYIKKSVYNGKIIHWGKLPITYGFKNTEGVPDYFIAETQNAFSVWEKALKSSIYFERNDKSPDITIIFHPQSNANDENKKYVVAYTTPEISSDNKLAKMEIYFCLKDIKEEYFSSIQVYNTALHEIAHALGFMGHSENKNNVMYMSKDSIDGYDEKTKLTEADISTLTLLYKIKPDITNSDKLEYGYIPAVALGSDEEITSAKIREARFYIQKAPHLPMGYIDLAAGYVGIKDYAKAIKALEKALQVADSNEALSIIYYNLAVSYYYIDNTEIAKNNLMKSIKIQDSEDKRVLLSEIYIKEGNREKAIEELDSLTMKYPSNQDYTISLTNMYVKEKDYGNARRILKNYFRNNPSEKKNPRFAPYGIIKLGL